MAELAEKYGRDQVQVELVVGEKGIFDVEVDGKVLYRKHDTGAFPRYGEIPMLIDMERMNA